MAKRERQKTIRQPPAGSQQTGDFAAGPPAGGTVPSPAVPSPAVSSPAVVFADSPLLSKKEMEASLAKEQKWMTREKSLWVFAFASLMWDPGFTPKQVLPARVHGFRRRFALYSVYYRGTPARPGLVAGLEEGGACSGLCLRVADTERERVLRYLWKREMLNRAYRPRRITVRSGEGRAFAALAFTLARTHPQYAGHLSDEERARLIGRAHGPKGSNAEYLRRTFDSLACFSLRCRHTERLLALTGSLPSGPADT